MRIAFFGATGPLSLGALGAIASGNTVAAVIQPAPTGTATAYARGVLGDLRRAVGGASPGSLDALRRRHRFPVWRARSGGDPDIQARLRVLQPDLICIAGYPWILPDDILTLPALGAINVHAALLPRHRGPLPLFWTYFHDDRRTGVTVHRATAEADAGDILGQISYPLDRGFPVEELNRLNGPRAAEVLGPVLRQLADGHAAARRQDEALATVAPRIRQGAPMVAFDSWDVERVWHFLAGLFPRFQEPLTGEDGVAIRYGAVQGYRRVAHGRTPGTVGVASGHYELYCHGGAVQLSAGS